MFKFLLLYVIFPACFNICIYTFKQVYESKNNNFILKSILYFVNYTGTDFFLIYYNINGGRLKKKTKEI